LSWSLWEYVRVRLVIAGNERLASARYHEPPEAFQRTCRLQLGHGSNRHQTLRKVQTGQNEPINHALDLARPSSPFLLPRSQLNRRPRPHHSKEQVNQLGDTRPCPARSTGRARRGGSHQAWKLVQG